MAGYPELRGRQNREGMQFLHYYGSKATDFYRSVFLDYFARVVVVSIAAVIIVAALPAYLVAGKTGLAWLCGVAALVFGTAALVRHFRNKNNAVSY
jgi:hypothetical protein